MTNMTEVMGRVLTAPKIQYGGRVSKRIVVTNMISIERMFIFLEIFRRKSL